MRASRPALLFGAFSLRWASAPRLAVVVLLGACASRGLDDVGTRTASPGVRDAGSPSATTEPAPPMTQPPPPAPSGSEPGSDVFDEPGCPSVPPPPSVRDCDPLGDAGSCGAGRGCFPYVEYPDAPCERERFGTRCETAGSGLQGDACQRGRCASGFLCVASRRGSVCARLCELPGRAACAPGLVCSAVDIEGYGVCH